jgi:transmembrane sensor
LGVSDAEEISVLMPYAPEPDFALLARYFAGEATPDQRSTVEAWAASDPARADELALLRGIWENGSAVPAMPRVDAMWSSLSRRMRGAHADETAKERRDRVSIPNIAPIVSRPRSRLPWLAAAAVVAFATLTVWSTNKSGSTSRVGDVATSTERAFVTARGERRTIRLGDRTRVELGYASTLRVRAFDGGRRELWLDGEATFDVVHDAARPFIVHAGGATTEDLGTSFAIRAYENDAAVRVLVMSGKVALRPTSGPAANGTVLLPGQLGRLRHGGLVEVQSVDDTSAYLGWRQGQIAFHGARIDEVAAELERRFDVPIRVADSGVAAQRVNLQNFPARALGEVLDAVTVPYDLRYRRVSGTVILER